MPPPPKVPPVLPRQVKGSMAKDLAGFYDPATPKRVAVDLPKAGEKRPRFEWL